MKVDEINLSLERSFEMAKLNAKTRKALNNVIHGITLGYRNSVPLDLIDDALRSKGYRLIQEDDTDWSGILCGADGHCWIAMAQANADGSWRERVNNSGLALSWHKMPSGRWETVAYLS